jgi:hypothetical protein
MIPKNANAQDEAVEALIAASLRAPVKEQEVTKEEIRRYVDQQVTLNSDDEAALEKSKLETVRAIGNILRGNTQIKKCITGETENNHPEKFVAMNRKNSANEFSQITDSELDRKRKEMLERLKKKQNRPKS